MSTKTTVWRGVAGMGIAGGMLVLALAMSSASAKEPRVLGTSEAAVRTAESASAANTSINGVEHIGCTVADLDQSVEFYTAVLSFKRVGEDDQSGGAFEHLTGVFGARARTARLRLGTEDIELTQFLAPEGRPVPIDSRSNDRWFQHIAIVVADMDRAYAHLRAHHVRHASSGPQTLPASIPAAAGISAFYFKDPDGHALEIIHFPPGKGDPRWQAPRDASELFLGIDHTAIVVGDTDASLRFYRDTLGLGVAGSSENFGTEQEHLNNVFGARLRITALRARHGPGIELLEYLAPADGRPYPADSRANDLWQWHTTLVTGDGAAITAALRREHARFVSLPTSGAPPADFMARDPDGHALLFRAPAPTAADAGR